MIPAPEISILIYPKKFRVVADTCNLPRRLPCSRSMHDKGNTGRSTSCAYVIGELVPLVEQRVVDYSHSISTTDIECLVSRVRVEFATLIN